MTRMAICKHTACAWAPCRKLREEQPLSSEHAFKSIREDRQPSGLLPGPTDIVLLFWAEVAWLRGRC